MLKSSYTTCVLVSEENETVIEVETERAGKVSFFASCITQLILLFILYQNLLHCARQNGNQFVNWYI